VRGPKGSSKLLQTTPSLLLLRQVGDESPGKGGLLKLPGQIPDIDDQPVSAKGVASVRFFGEWYAGFFQRFSHLLQRNWNIHRLTSSRSSMEKCLVASSCPLFLLHYIRFRTLFKAWELKVFSPKSWRIEVLPNWGAGYANWLINLNEELGRRWSSLLSIEVWLLLLNSSTRNCGDDKPCFIS
jgi:hypothetical protein